ncbi:MAG TPA: FAD-binding protein, partial [Kutzneria sp.]|nr:FAD-binding protein [Kutzneria sp.]
GSPHGGVFLDVSSRLPAEEIIRRLPSMHHQFKELADVDITKEPMEVGPTCHYVMGGVEVEPDTAASSVAGLFACGEVAGGMHGSNRLGGNSLSDLLVFGRRAGAGASAYVDSLGDKAPVIAESDVDEASRRAVAVFEGGDAGAQENPYSVHTQLQQTMNDLVGIIRRGGEVEQALVALEDLKQRARNIVVEGHRQFNPGWHLALDLRNMLLVSECVAKAALLRTESRGGHTREDHPVMDADWRKQLLVCNVAGDGVDVTPKDQIPLRPDLMGLFEYSELAKYFTPGELADIPAKES